MPRKFYKSWGWDEVAPGQVSIPSCGAPGLNTTILLSQSEVQMRRALDATLLWSLAAAQLRIRLSTLGVVALDRHTHPETQRDSCAVVR